MKKHEVTSPDGEDDYYTIDEGFGLTDKMNITVYDSSKVNKSDNLPRKPNRLSNIFYTLEVPQSSKTFDNEFAEIMANTVIEKMSGPFSKTIVANISNYQDLEYARKKYPGMFLDQGYELQADYGDVCDRCGKPINRNPGNTNFLCYDCNKIVNENKRPLTRGSILKQPSEQVILSSL
jgi:hypothetical protein